MKVLLFVLFTISLTSFGQERSKEKKVILFVCEHGGARSLIASLYFNKMAAEKKLNYTSVFRGTQPDAELNMPTVSGLKKDGFAIPDQKPTLVSSSDMTNASKIIAIDCTMPIESAKQNESWSNVPSISQDYVKARDEIVKHVWDLIAALEQKN